MSVDIGFLVLADVFLKTNSFVAEPIGHLEEKFGINFNTA